MTPVVDVVILTWNDGELLGAAVRSALDSNGVEVRVIVVDNGSDPPASVDPDSRVTVVRNDTNAGVAPGRNQGARIGTSPVVCFLDSDAVLAPHSLARMTEVLDGHPDVGVVVPVFAGQPPEASAGRAPTLRVKASRGFGHRSTYEAVTRAPDAALWDVDFGIGACQVLRRRVFDEVGGLDDAIFYGPEDVDFCLRVRDAGHRVVQVDGTDVVHPPRRSNRKPLTWRGVKHAWTIIRHLWRHRGRQN